MAKKPPNVTVVVPPATGGKKHGTDFEQFVAHWEKQFPTLRTNSQAILAVAKAEHIDPVTFAALLLNESGAGANEGPSSVGAVGIGQLLPSTFIGPNSVFGGVLPWAPKHQVTKADLLNPGINMRLAAAYFGKLQGDYPADPYGRYNAGPNADPKYTAQLQTQFWKKWVTPWNPTYVGSAPTSPPGRAGQQVPGGTGLPAADNTFRDPYVTGVKKGQNGKFTTTNDPNKAMQWNGAPLTRSAFLTLKNSLASHYISYTGQRPSNAQIQQFVLKGWSTYTLDNLLSKGKNFKKSPIYSQYSKNLGAAVKDLLPKDAKIPDELLRQATVNQWSADAVAQQLRKLPTYIASNEFKGNIASLLNVHNSIMGTPDEKGMIAVKDAALSGWSSDQYAAYLRSQPSYSSSPEYQSKALSFLSGLGLLTGSQAVLAKGVGPGPGAIQPDTQGALAGDSRVAKGAKPVVAPPLPGLGATLNR